MPGPIPRVFIIRHGETEWSLNGRHTGTSDIPLTANGEKRITATGRALVGNDRLIVPRKLAHIYVSPRSRAQKTLQLLMEESVEGKATLEKEGKKMETTEDIREWDYGDYEGITSKEIQKQREKDGLPPWDIWSDGCPNGESPEDITKRLDGLIADIRKRFHEPAMRPNADQSGSAPRDVLVVAHGHILRAFAARWVKHPVSVNPSFLLEAGGVGTLSYEHNSIEEPAILLGGSFVTDVVEEVEAEAKREQAEKNVK